jgi:DNA-binding CsgD family transcriptional regulator
VQRASAERSRLLERDRELAQIQSLLSSAAAGSGRLLVLEGPGGIGKSTLLDEARRLALGLELNVLRARGDELERANPFGIATALLESPFLRGRDDVRRRLLAGPAALATPLLRPEDTDPHTWGAAEEFDLVHGLYWAVVNLAEMHPLALLVDDVHWADDLSLRFLLYLTQRIDDLPVALVVSIRTGDPAAESELIAKLTTAGLEPVLTLSELSVEAVHELLAAVQLEVGDSGSFASATWNATRGNPFLIHELVATLGEDPGARRRLDAAGVGAFAPQSVGRTVAVRLRRLGDDALELARACAVLGSEAPLPRAAHVAGLALPAAADAAERLVSAQIMAESDPLSFRHPMIRSAVYAELPPGAKRRAHLTAARVLHDLGFDPVDVGHHLLAGTPCDEPWVRETLHEAGRIAARKGAPATALPYLRRALELQPRAEGVGALLVDLGVIEAATGETTSLERFEAALGLIDEPAEQARALYALGQTLYRYGRLAEAADTFQRGAALFEHHERELWLTFEGAAMCCALYGLAMRDAAMRRLESLVSEMPSDRPPTDAERTLLAVHAGTLSLTTPPAAAAAEAARRALGERAPLREQSSESMAVIVALFALIHTGFPAEAELYLNELLADASQRGAALTVAEASTVRAVARLARGRINEAMADAQAAIEGIAFGARALVPMAHAVLARCHIERGELDAADAVVREAEPLLPDIDAMAVNAKHFDARGAVRLAGGQVDEALADFLATGKLLASYDYINPAVVAWRTSAALAAHATGDDRTARALLDEQLTLAREFELSASVGAALHARALVNGSDIATLEAAAATLENSGTPLGLARALFDLGAARRRDGQRVASREPLRRALELAHQCGATALEQQVREELLASGARPRRVTLSGIEALTPSERRIADLVAAGNTNRAVAEKLVLTTGTVNWHLKHIYLKLDIRSRQQLTELLSTRKPPAARP